MNRLYFDNERARVFKTRVIGDWAAVCPCMIPVIHRSRWREAYAALLKHMKEVHL